MSCRTIEKTPHATTAGDYIADCESLSKMELRRRYRAEANTHRNMLSRQKSRGAVIHPEFREFASFLRHVGPVPAPRATLDRIENSDPEYGPGKVRWADKRTQNNNKSDTLVFYYSRTGDTYTTSRLAKLRNVSTSAIRKGKERGWTDDEIIEGKRAAPPSSPLHSSGYVQKHSPSLQQPRPLTADEIRFKRMADYYQSQREMYGEEPLPMSYEDMQEHPEFASVTPEKYERKFARLWPEHRPHLNFDNASAAHQKLIAKIDPRYVLKIAATRAKSNLLRAEI